ncbi:MAG: methyltransferase domain-containing protein [Candidatus Tectimicrobiota bacterium]
MASRLPWLDRLLVACRLLTPTEFSAKTFYTNLLHRFPWQANTVEAIYMGEMLEHFTQEEAQHILHECYRVLQPGGRLRIRVPDHARFWQHYIEEYAHTAQQPRASWSLDHTRWTTMYFRDICIRRPRLWQSMGHYHKWMYDEISLILLLEAAGFQHVERRALHHSGIPQIEDVETRDDLIVEAIRP